MELYLMLGLKLFDTYYFICGQIFDVQNGVDYRVSSVEQSQFYKNKHIDQIIFEVEVSKFGK